MQSTAAEKRNAAAMAAAELKIAEQAAEKETPMPESGPTMQYSGFTARVVGRKLVIEIDLDSDLGPSSSGKTLITATSHGNTKIAGTGLTLGLNAYRYAVEK